MTKMLVFLRVECGAVLFCADIWEALGELVALDCDVCNTCRDCNRCSKPKPYAAVLPDPVAAVANTSWPCKMSGMPCSWIGVGCVHPARSAARHKLGDKPSEVNVNGRYLMAEVAHATKHHRNTALVGGVDHFLVAHRAARLNDASSACIDHHI